MKLPLPSLDDFIANISERVASRVAERVAAEIPRIVTEAIMAEMASMVKSVPGGIRDGVGRVFTRR